jgi:formate hydrogenlyase subunit 6/NADH:ubiquinone oxidoreductase subunit I
MKECPADALELITLDKKAKQFVMRYHVDRCTYCAQCVQNCRFECLEMAPDEWELAATSKQPFTIYYGDEADVEKVLGGFVAGDGDEA